MLHRSHGRLSHQVHLMRQRIVDARQLPLTDLLCPQQVQRVIEQEGGLVRDCLWSPLVTIYTFLSQVLGKDHSCREAVARRLAWFVAHRQTACSPDTGPYCKARRRLPEPVPMQLARQVGRELHQQTPADALLGGRPIKIIDGTTVSMPDTPANQQEYPQANTQKLGLGFPTARIVALISLSCGVVLDLAIGPYKGKQTGETALFRSLWNQLNQGDVVLGDRYFGSFWHMALLLGRGVDSVVRLHQLRKADFRRGKRLSKDDHIVLWLKPKQKPDWMEPATYAQLPDVIDVREVKVAVKLPGFRVKQLILATTLLDAATVTHEELARVYLARWHAELDLRSIKSVMQMDVLRCKTPAMVRKEIGMHLLGYNLIRTVMAQAAEAHHLRPRQLSFTGAMQTLGAFHDVISLTNPSDWPRRYRAMLQAIAHHRVGDRPNRYEPRAIKRRPKPHKLLTVAREHARCLLTQTT